MSRLNLEKLCKHEVNEIEQCQKIENLVEQENGISIDCWPASCFDNNGNLLPGHPLAERYRNMRLYKVLEPELKMRQVDDAFLMCCPIERIRARYIGRI